MWQTQVCIKVYFEKDICLIFNIENIRSETFIFDYYATSTNMYVFMYVCLLLTKTSFINEY